MQPDAVGRSTIAAFLYEGSGHIVCANCAAELAPKEFTPTLDYAKGPVLHVMYPPRIHLEKDAYSWDQHCDECGCLIDKNYGDALIKRVVRSIKEGRWPRR